MDSYSNTVVQRNIVIVGMEDSEKKKIAEYIFQGDNIKPLSPCERRSGSYEPKECVMKFEDSEYKVAVMDTQGLSRDPRKNKSIIKQIEEAACHYFDDEIHLVLFVIGFGRVSDDVRKAIDQFFQYTNPDIINASAVVFSSCSLTQDAWNDYKEALYRDVEWSSKMKLGCHYVDFADIDKMTEKCRLTSLDRTRISRCNLVQLIRQAKCSRSISLSDSRTVFKEYGEGSCCCSICVQFCRRVLSALIACVLWCYKCFCKCCCCRCSSCCCCCRCSSCCCCCSCNCNI